MPEANSNGAGGFDLSSLSSVLQNEDTMRQLRQMAESMGLGTQLDGVLNQIQAAPAEPSRPEGSEPGYDGQNENTQRYTDGPVSIPVSGAQPPGNRMNGGNGYNRGPRNPQSNGHSSRNNGNTGFSGSQNGQGTAGENSDSLSAGLNSLLSNPAALAQLGKVMQAMNNRGPEYTFLSSLKPLLRPEKASKVDQALQIMQMMQALQMVGGNNGAMRLPGLLGFK